MSKIRVGVLRGGPSDEYEVSLKTGAGVLANLPARFRPVDILLTKNGAWQVDGLPTGPTRLIRQVDVIFNCLHGQFGEDGGVQRLLDQLMIPYSGSTALASAIGMNKILTKQYLAGRPIKLPYGLPIDNLTDVKRTTEQIFRRISPPWVIKPADRGSSVGVLIVKQLSQLPTALAQVADWSDNLLVEEYIAGREATVGVVDNFRGQSRYTLPPVEIRPPASKSFFDYEAKCNDVTEKICPGNFTEAEKATMQAVATEVHQALGLRHYSRSDFIVNQRGVYFLEVNTLPGLTAESLLPKALAAVGCSYADFLDHVLSLALTTRT